MAALELTAWQALWCLLAGFLLAATPAAPILHRLLLAVVRAITGHQPPSTAFNRKEADALMTHAPPVSTVFVQEAHDRSRTARHLIAELSRALPAQADAWPKLDRALVDVGVLTTEITRLRFELVVVRLERANLAAAGRATLTAHRSGEPSPLTYLRDELSAQGFWRERP